MEHNDDERRKREIGTRIRTLRLARELGQKTLAASINCAQSQISEWESGQHVPRYPRLGQLARELGCSEFYLLTGSELPNAPRSTEVDSAFPTFAASLIRDFMDGAASAFGEPIDDLMMLKRLVLEHPSALPRLIEPCHKAVADARYVSSGSEARAVSGLLDRIIEIANLARRRRIEAAQQLFFDANDRAVHCQIFSAEALSERAELYLGGMAQVALELPSLKAGYYARLGDVLHVLAWTWNDPVINAEALGALQQSMASAPRSSRKRTGYHAIRTVPIVAARCSTLLDSAFDQIIEQAYDRLERSSVTDHEAAHVIDGIAEASAQRYLLTGTSHIRAAALRHWEKAKAVASRATAPHALFDVHLARVPVILGRAGIVDHLGDTDEARLANLHTLTKGVQQRAAAAGSPRMSAELANLASELTTLPARVFWSRGKERFL